MARLDKRKPSEVTNNTPPGGSHVHAPTHHGSPPAYASGALYSTVHDSVDPYQVNTATHTSSPTGVASGSQRDVVQSQAKVQSHDSFKKFIEGPKYHPNDYSFSESHSRANSATSVGSDRLSVVHARTMSTETIHSPGRTSSHSIEDFESAKRKSIVNRQGYGNETELRAVQGGYGDHGSGLAIAEPSGELTVKHIKDVPPTVVPYRNIQTHQSTMEQSSDLPGVHKRRNTANWVEQRSDFVTRHPRPEPDGEDTSHQPPSQDSTRNAVDLRHIEPPVDSAVDTAPIRRKSRLQRQVGVHVSDDDVSPGKPQRPQTEYLDRSQVYEDRPVLMRNTDGKPRRGYLNSAYIEDVSLPLETISENIPSVMPAKPHHFDRLPTQHHQNLHQGVSSTSHVTNRHQNEKCHVARVRVTNEMILNRHPMKRTVNEANKERDDQVMLRRQYFQQRHPAYNIDHLHNMDSTVQTPSQQQRLSMPSHAEPRTTKFESQQQKQKCAKQGLRASTESQNHLIYKPQTSRQQPLHRSPSISPDRKRQSRFTGDSRIPAQPPDVGLQKFTRYDSATTGAAIMVHMAPSGDKERNQAEKTSPVIIQVGAMTLERIKRQISRKNKYSIQPKEKVKRLTKPRTHFTLSLFTMCFCLSPLGFVAMIFAVCSDSAYKARDAGMGRCLSKAALGLSILGIMATIATAAILIGTNTIPIIGRYGEPDGN